MIYDIAPMAKPRMTRSDKWKKRKCVLAYWAWCEEVRLNLWDTDLNDKSIIFYVPMPKSWSKKKKALNDGQCHTSKPDLDNMLKALFDALYGDDSHIHTLNKLQKKWAYKGAIEIHD